ncbi:hypothetical protein [Sunxiuqinia indica]|uniref:hypothetical protein n=1 Tax=Sunxiuqinia indica TaxID=2692584 RepID=UPI0013597B3D|nr:hypothetical protein [Sunxiuqinia indica]
MENQINVELLAEDLDLILQSIVTIREKMPFLVRLTPEEKKTLAMMDDGRAPFTEKAIDYAGHEPALNPNETLLDESRKDISLYESLGSVERELSRLTEMVSDTRMLAGAEAYETARIIYKMAKIAASMSVPGTKTIVDDLGKLYQRQGKTQK